LIIAGIGVVLSGPMFSQPMPGVDAPMHLSKISRLWTFFPSLPTWFPWWYCGTPLLKMYPPLMYITNISVTSIFNLQPWIAVAITDTICFVLTGCFIFLFLRKIGIHELACLFSSIFYLSSFQTLSGRFGFGHYTHTFAMLFLVFGIYMVEKTHSSKYYEIGLASIICLLFLSHLSVAISFIGLFLTYYIGVFLAKFIDARSDSSHILSLSRSVLGAIIGVLLSAFWLIPYLMNGGAGATSFMSSATNYVSPLQSLFVFDSQNIWFQSYYLGIPLIVFGIFGLLISIYKKVFWGIIFTSWTFFFLLMSVQPYIFQGLSLGYPARYPFFIAFSFCLLAGVACDYFFRKFSSILSKIYSSVLFRIILVLLLTSFALSVNPVVIKGYELENRVSEDLSLHLTSYERLASISTFSYTFNVLSNSFQIDGGYIEGNINLQFYREYWFEIYYGHDLEATINILKKINARLVLFHGEISPEVERKFVAPYFSVILDEPPIKVFELNGTLVPLNFVEVVNGKADEVDFVYSNPDVLELTLVNCSEDTELIVKMNYEKGWTAYCNDVTLPLIRNEEGFMNVIIPFQGDLKIKLQYGSTIIDYIALTTTIATVLICFFLFLRKTMGCSLVSKVFRIQKKN
jgi:hypothetical protein